jgi:alpha-beta hydrolase superfamily lysophospholipase
MAMREVAFRSRDGLPLAGTLVLPEPDVRAGVLLVHGITSERHESGFYTSLADLLAEVGIASLRFDWRCHGSNSLASRDMTLLGIVNDIDAAAGLLVEQVVGGPLAFVAASFGGGVATYWAAHRADLNIRGAVLLAPVLDYAADLFRAGEIDGSLYFQSAAAAVLAATGQVPTTSLPVGRGLVNELPFVSCAEAFRVAPFPITVFHGGSDHDVPLGSSQNAVDAKGDAELIVVPDVDHGFIVPGSEFVDSVNRSTHDQVIAAIRDRLTLYVL